MESLPPRLLGPIIPEYVRATLRALHDAGSDAYLVGGCVRDLLRGVRPKDYDVCCAARPERVLGLFPHTVPTGLQHGTVTVVQREGSVEVTTFRGESSYADGRRPDQVFFLDSIEADLARRDFTINAMAFDPWRGRLIDPYGGAADLALRRVRCVGVADERFGEDGLRPLRAVRFAGVLRFEIAPETLAAIPRSLGTYARVAIERIADELRKLLKGPQPSRGLGLLASTGLAARILPTLSTEPEATRRLRFARVDFVPPAFALRLAALFRGEMAALDNLKLPTAVTTRVQRIEQAHLPATPDDPAELRRFAARATPAGARDALKLARADALARKDSGRLLVWRVARATLARVLSSNPPLRVKDLALDGAEVAATVGAHGPEVGKALRDLLEAVLDRPDLNTPEQLREILGRR